MKNVIKAEVRLEGEVNQEWTLTYTNGSTEKFYAYEESPRRSETDEKVYETDEKLSDWLIEISNVGLPVRVGDLDAIEYTIDFLKRTITVTKVQLEREDYADKPQNVVRKF